MIEEQRRPLLIETIDGRAVITATRAGRMAPLRKDGAFDRRYKTAPRDERYVRMIRSHIKRHHDEWAEKVLALPSKQRIAGYMPYDRPNLRLG